MVYQLRRWIRQKRIGWSNSPGSLKSNTATYKIINFINPNLRLLNFFLLFLQINKKNKFKLFLVFDHIFSITFNVPNS